MRAIRVSETGGPETLKVDDIDIPRPGSKELRIKIEATGINFVDVYYRSGVYDVDLPFTPGMEAAGVVDAVGDDVDDWSTGTRCAYVLEVGTYAEFAIVPANRVVRLPNAIDIETAAGGLLQGLTAHYLANNIASLEAGDVVLVHAAAGGLGQMLTQTMKQLDVHVIGTVSSAAKAKVARAAGVDDVIVYTQTDFASEVSRITNRQGVAAVFDSVGLTTWEGSLRSVRRRGHLVLCGQASGLVPPIDPQLLRTNGSITLSRPGLKDFIADRSELEQRSDAVFGLISDGHVVVRIEDTFSLEHAPHAHRLIESRSTTGKLLLTPGTRQ